MYTSHVISLTSGLALAKRLKEQLQIDWNRSISRCHEVLAVQVLRPERVGERHEGPSSPVVLPRLLAARHWLLLDELHETVTTAIWSFRARLRHDTLGGA